MRPGQCKTDTKSFPSKLLTAAIKIAWEYGGGLTRSTSRAEAMMVIAIRKIEMMIANGSGMFISSHLRSTLAAKPP
jgi:hypothetical protein